MAYLHRAQDISSAWVGSIDYLLSEGGTASNLIVEILVGAENRHVRAEFDSFIASKTDSRLAPIDRVADTIFPIDFYRGGPSKEARDHLYKMERLAARVEQRFVGVSYFDRLIDWPYRFDGKTEGWNQLEYRIQRLETAWQGGKRTMNIAELGISSGLPDDEDAHVCVPGGDLRTQHPFKDTTPIGFPCLSHISLTLFKGRLDLTATYRNQHYITKAYGNFVGLARLHRFICMEVGCPMGSLVCIATHADAELGKNKISKKQIQKLVEDCKEKLNRENFD